MEDRIILVDKPAGISSFGAVARVRRELREEFGHKVKVGHTGTLDPFATGLLILLSGKMTKRANEFLKLDKEYEAEMMLGKVSTTGDPEGEITEYVAKGQGQAAAVLKREKIDDALLHFTGKIKQKVPAFSAVKINGERAYKLARKGKEFETPTREIEIYQIDVIEYAYPVLKIRCRVSSGTYIRTLAEDIGEYLDVGAYLTGLRRTKIADYDVKNAVRIEK